MSAPEVPTIVTRVAKICHDDHRWFGRSVLREMSGAGVVRESYASVIATAISGRRFSAEACDVLDEMAVLISAADPRVWPLKITRLVASYGGMLAGFVAGHLCMEGDRIGPPIARHAATMLAELMVAVGGTEVVRAATDSDRDRLERAALAVVSTRKRLIGYGIPFRPEDERYVALRAMIERRGREVLPWWRLHSILNDVVRQERKLPPNIGIGVAAMALDLGFLPDEIGAVPTFFNINCFVANAVEGANQQAAVLRCLPDTSIDYVGFGPRESPRARMTSGRSVNT